MRVFWKLAPTAIAVVALVLVLIQTVRLGRLSTRHPPAATATRAAADSPERLARLEHRVSSLERAVRRLVSLALVRPAGPATGRQPDPVLLGWLKSEVTSLRDEVDDVVAGQAASGTAGRKRLRTLLRKAQQEERRRHRARWAQVAEHLQRATLDKFAAEARVDDETRSKLDRQLRDERQRLFSLFDEFREGKKDLPTALAEARQILSETDADARRLLDAEQYRAYQTMRDDMPGMRRLRRLGVLRK